MIISKHENSNIDDFEVYYDDGDYSGISKVYCDPPINAQFVLDLIFKTLIDDKEHYPYLTTIPESTEQTNAIMLDLILTKYSREYRRFRKENKDD